MQLPKSALAAAALTLVAAHTASADVVGQAISAGGDVNLTSYVNPYDTLGGGTNFASAADSFAILARPGSAPFAIYDDSVSIFTGDTQGFIGETDTDPFLSIVDTLNGDNPSSAATATFNFDASGTSGPLTLLLDIAAMGDFEDGVVSTNPGVPSAELAEDFLHIFVSIDGGPAIQLGDTSVDAAGARTYVMDGGATVELTDPISFIAGATTSELTEDFQTFSLPLGIASSSVSVSIVSNVEGGDEAIGVRNLIIDGTPAIPEPATIGLLSVAGLGLLRRRSA